MQANTSYGCASIVMLVTCCALLVCWSLAEVLALDPRPADLVAIGKVVEDPQHFNLHRVRFQGTITKITALPNQGGCGTFPGYVFQFQDETGSIEVFDTGWCSEGSSAAPLLVVNPVRTGDRCSIAATVVYSTHAPGPLLRARLQWIGEVGN